MSADCPPPAPMVAMAERHATEQRLIALIARATGLARADVTPSLRLRRDLRIDGEELAALELAIWDEFGVAIDVMPWHRLADLAALVIDEMDFRP